MSKQPTQLLRDEDVTRLGSPTTTTATASIGRHCGFIEMEVLSQNWGLRWKSMEETDERTGGDAE